MSEDLQPSYDRVAEDYAEHFRDEIDNKPFERKVKYHFVNLCSVRSCSGYATHL